VEREETAEWFKVLLKNAAASQPMVAEWVSERVGMKFDQSRLSRSLHGEATLNRKEKEALMAVLVEKRVVTHRWDAQRIAVVFGMERQVLDAAFPPEGVVTNLSPPGERVYVRPSAHDVLLAKLVSEQPLDERARAWFVALVGAPGSGKSELAQRLTFEEAVIRRYDVVLYAGLRGRALGDAEAVLNEWLVALGESPVAGGTAGAALRSRLRGQQVLVILDDLPGREWIGALFVGDERGAVLAVCSQQVADEVGIAGGDVVELPLWDEGLAQRFLEALIDRALTPAQVSRLKVLNSLVDGLPLAWSLLTPWLRGVADWSLVEEVLTESPLTALSRIERCFAAAYERLPVEVQEGVRALAVFAASPFDVEAVGAVLGISKGEAARRVAALKAAAWLRESPLAPPETRYQLHRLLHRYAVRLTADDPLRDEYAERHARFYAERAAPLLERQHEADWPDVVRRLLPDLPNLYQGQAWAAVNRHPLAMDYFLHVAPYFSAFREDDRWQEWAEAAQEVVEENPAVFPAIHRFSLYSQLGWGEGTFEERLAYLRRAHEIATTETEPWTSVYSLTDLARLYLEPGQLAEAEAVLLEAWQVAEASERAYLRAWTLREIGLYYARTLNRDGCAVMADRLAVDMSEGLEGAYDEASRGEVLACAGRWEEALRAYREALAFHEATGSRVQGSEVRLYMVRCLAHLGREEEASNEIAAVEAYLDELPPESVRLCHSVVGEAARLRGDHPAAVKYLSVALASNDEVAAFRWRVEFDAWLNLGQALQALGRNDEAMQASASARELAINGHQPFWLWEVNRCQRVSESSTRPPSQVSELMSLLRGREWGAPPASML